MLASTSRENEVVPRKAHHANPRRRRIAPLATILAPSTDGTPETGIFGVGIGVGVGDGPGVAVGPNVGVGPVETRQFSEETHTLLLSRTWQEKLYAPEVMMVYVVVSEPGLPTFCSTSLVDPSGIVNSAAVISPSSSRPVQVNVTVYGGVPDVGLTVSSVHTGFVFPNTGVGVTVGDGAAVGVGVSVGVGGGVCVGVFVVVPVGVGVAVS